MWLRLTSVIKWMMMMMMMMMMMILLFAVDRFDNKICNVIG